MSTSVVIAAYGAEGHLREAVRSCAAQTEPLLEVIVVDDASTDATLATAHQLAAEHPFVRVVALPVNGGPAVARNAGFDVARGDWLAVLDADDTMSPGRLAAMRAVGEAERADVVLDNFVFRNAATGDLRPSRIPTGDGHEPVDRYRFLAAARAFNDEPTWTLLQPLLRRSFVEEHGLRYPTDSRHGEDYLFMVEALLSGARCVRLRTPGYLYTQRHQGMSTTRLDYDDLVTRTEQLLQDPRIAADRRAAHLLRRRLAATRCLRAERQGRLVAATVRDPAVAGVVARRAALALRRRALRSPADLVGPLL